MQTTDIRRVSQIDRRAFGNDGWPIIAFQEEIQRNPLARYSVLDADDVPLPQGYIGCWLLDDAVHIVTVAVDPLCQRRGLGGVLVQHAITLAHENDVPGVTLECRESNSTAQALYRKYGFSQAGRRKRYYHNGEDALILTVSGVNEARYQRAFRARCSMHLRRHGLKLVDEDGS